MSVMNHSAEPVVLVTGAAQRIGAVIARHLHGAGYRVVLHYHQSHAAAQALCTELNTTRAQSAIALPANFNDVSAVHVLAKQAVDAWGRLDALINNASTFYPTPLGEVTAAQWDELFASNARAPFFLSQALVPALAAQQGAIVNIADIYAQTPLQQHAVYCMAKAANKMLTLSLARELAPAVRVNGIAPGAILWPEQGGAQNEAAQMQLLQQIPLRRMGTPEDIARTVLFLLRDAPYITGQVLAVDGGRSTGM